jgi:hypothetical protein
MELLELEKAIELNNELIKDANDVLRRIKNLSPSRQRSLAITNQEQSIMWLNNDNSRLEIEMGKIKNQ